MHARRSRRGSVTCWRRMNTGNCNSNWSSGRRPGTSFRMLFAYPKNELEDLTLTQRQALRRIVESEYP